MTRVLLVGSGAREHAIASSLTKSPDVELYAAMSSRNPGIMKLAKDSRVLKITDAEAVSDYVNRTQVDFGVVGPEAPLVSGVGRHNSTWDRMRGTDTQARPSGRRQSVL